MIRHFLLLQGINFHFDLIFPDKESHSLQQKKYYTTTLAGYHRVFLSCRARAIENQCYVATSFVVNRNDLSGEADDTFSMATILSPADTGFPDDGVIAQGVMNQPMLVISDLDVKALDSVRQNGQVHNFEDAKRFIKFEMGEIKIIHSL